jgi:chromate transporter
MATIRRVRYLIFLRDVFFLSLTSFGGPQGHLAMFIDMLVKKRGYLTEEELLELFALCQVLPGPTSTQTITAIGHKIGGPNLAYLTLLIWVLPAVGIMTFAAITIVNLQTMEVPLDFLRFIQPMTIGIVALSSYRISNKVVNTRTGVALMIIGGVASYLLKSPFAFPVLILMGGLVTALKFEKQPKEEKEPLVINWSNFILWGGVLVLAATLGHFTGYRPVALFENFYRNGSLIFGGGQVLVPLIYTEFVEFKDYLTSEEFISGYGVVQALPGPTFSFSAYIGGLGMRADGPTGMIIGSVAAALGVFLPGTFLIFFVIRFWTQLKKYRVIRASIEGIQAVSAGMVLAAAWLMFEPMDKSLLNFLLLGGTAGVMYFTKIPTPFIIVGGLVVGIVLG